jgi:hypothetical protein
MSSIVVSAGLMPVVGHDLGALPLIRDRRDVAMERLAPIREALGSLPASADLSNWVAGVYDQGTVPACTCCSAAAMQSIFESQERGKWLGFDALECYHAVGGTGSEGVEPHDVLGFMQGSGLLQVGTSRRYRIGSYAFVQLGPGGRIDIVKASIAARRPAVMAMLLPADWSQNYGQSAGDAVSSSYHQVCLTGYDAARVYFVNSQGEGWGDSGFGSVPWTFVQSPDQLKRCYAYTAIDEIDDDLTS